MNSNLQQPTQTANCIRFFSIQQINFQSYLFITLARGALPFLPFRHLRRRRVSRNILISLFSITFDGICGIDEIAIFPLHGVIEFTEGENETFYFDF